MKIYAPKIDTSKIGGGLSFYKNFVDLASDYITDSLVSATHYFIHSATLCQRNEVDLAKSKGLKIVMRADGVPEDWRNRGTGWSRFRDFINLSDIVIYQSDFIANTIGRMFDKEYKVIYNGVDTYTFNLDGPAYSSFGSPSILYVNYRKAEHNKRVEEAIERFRYYKLDNPYATMTFVGNYSKQQFFWGNYWDFGMLDMEMNVDWRYLGILTDRNELAKIMRSSEYIAFPSFADPCPNTLIEAMACGCKPLWINDYGGQADIVRLWNERDWSRERMVKEYLDVMEGI